METYFAISYSIYIKWPWKPLQIAYFVSLFELGSAKKAYSRAISICYNMSIHILSFCFQCELK